MVSEDHYFRAKGFLGIYAEALNTLKDCAAKEGYKEYSERFYEILNGSVKKKQLAFDDEGNVVKGAGVRANYWYRIGELSQSWVLRKFKKDSKDYGEFYTNLETISKELDSEISLLQQKKAQSS